MDFSAEFDGVTTQALTYVGDLIASFSGVLSIILAVGVALAVIYAFRRFMG